MSKTMKIGMIAVVVGAIGTAVGLKLGQSHSNEAETATAPAGGNRRPRLLDLGSKKCIPCKRMAPILEELKKEYASSFDVEFIDVWLKENAAVGAQYGIGVIPTQIFFDANGKELWRHEGFLGKQAILAKWKELGYDFGSTASTFERWKADTAVAWFGMRKKADGKWGSAGRFHQANFVDVANLRKWVEGPAR